eukprot:1869566-Amphidinium_carterae.2
MLAPLEQDTWKDDSFADDTHTLESCRENKTKKKKKDLPPYTPAKAPTMRRTGPVVRRVLYAQVLLKLGQAAMSEHNFLSEPDLVKHV